MEEFEFDWFHAISLGLVGLVLGPMAAFAFWCLYSSLYWPTGESSIAASMEFWFALPVVLASGVVFGPIFGFATGLFGRRMMACIFNLWKKTKKRLRLSESNS